MSKTHYFSTANVNNYELARLAADKFGLPMHWEVKPTCCKKYHFDITARDLDEVTILDLIILATTAHTEQAKYREKLIKRIYA